jgi:hypothetical protein
MLFERLQAHDHRLDARARMLVAREQLRTFGRELLLAVTQAAIFFLQRAAKLEESVDPLGDRSERLFVRGHGGNIASGIVMPASVFRDS